MSDGYIQVPPDSTGKRTETTELTRSDGVVVERQRIAIGDGKGEPFFLQVNSQGQLVATIDQSEVLTELKRIAFLLEQLTGVRVSAKDVR